MSWQPVLQKESIYSVALGRHCELEMDGSEEICCIADDKVMEAEDEPEKLFGIAGGKVMEAEDGPEKICGAR